jgi:O-antigen/teichoic acid export membrane protein
MMAQAIILLAVIWVDSGFNVQSQQEAARTLESEVVVPQALLDNLIARSIAALKAMGVLIFVPLFIPEMTYALLLASLPLLIGTLLFPQWWLLATGRGFYMGLVTVLGRLASALLVWWLVRSNSDVLMAALAISMGSLLSGLILMSSWLVPLYRNHERLSWSSWRAYVLHIKPTLLPAFFASACAQLPVVALGAFAGTVQTGLFSAADRLTRAGGHMLSLVEQSFVTQWLQPIANQSAILKKMRQRIFYILPFTLGIVLLIAWYLAPWVIHFLYNDRFLGAVLILRVLLLWVWLQTVRRFLVAIFWLIDRDIKLQAYIQWFEVFLYLMLVTIVAILSHISLDHPLGLTAAYGLCIIEISLCGMFFILHKRKARSILQKPDRSHCL